MGKSRTLILVGVVAALGIAGCGSSDPIGVGNTPPSFTVASLAGATPVSSDSLKGKVVIVDFWATWCGPCNMELPRVEKIWHQYKDKGVDLLAISAETNDVLANFQKVTKTSVPIYVDAGGKTNHDLRITGYPTTFILGKDGRIVYCSVGYDDSVDVEIEAAINKALS